MELHYKFLFNDSHQNEFCWMSNESTFMMAVSNKSGAFTAIKYLPDWFTNARRTYQYTVCFSGLILNFLIATALFKNRHLRQESLTPCVVSLTIANIVTYICGFGYTLSKHIFSRIRCPTYGGAILGTMLCSSLNLFGIASLRCVKFNFSTRLESKTFKRASLFIAIFSWIGACIIIMPTATGNWGQFGWECMHRKCRFINYNNDGAQVTWEPEKVYYSLLITIGFANFLMNLGTYIKVKKDCKNIATDIEGFDSKASLHILRKEKQVTKMLGFDSAQYLILCLPKAIFHLMDPNSINNESLSYIIVSILWYTSGFIEALTILLFQRKYRKEIMETLQSICLCYKNKSGPVEVTISKQETIELRYRTHRIKRISLM